MNSYKPSSHHHHHRFGNNFGSNSKTPYNHPSDSEETSSTHSVRVSRLIEKIKAQQHGGNTGGYLRNSFNNGQGTPFSYSNNDLIYSRVAREQDQKRTVRERVPERNPPTNFHHHHQHQHQYPAAPFHKTTVLLNNDDDTDSDAVPWTGYKRGFSEGTHMNSNTTATKARYFGEETDYEYDRELSREVSSRGVAGPGGAYLGGNNAFAGGGTLRRNQSFGGDLRGAAATPPPPQRNSVPKIILHEEAVAEIPNGGKRTPSFLDDEIHSNHAAPTTTTKSNRFLGGLLTLKRNKGTTKHGTVRSRTRSPQPHVRPGGAVSSSYLNVPGASSTTPRHHMSHQDNNEHDSSSSPKYYVPYYRSTPTLYESRYDRMSSTGGSVLSNGSYLNKHVSRSMSMKAPWEPRHRANEIDYYDHSYGKDKLPPAPPPPAVVSKKRTLTRSKSMPGKKLFSWVSKRKSPEKPEETKLIVPEVDTNKSNKNGVTNSSNTGTTAKSTSNWGRFTLLRFGKGGKNKKHNGNQRGSSTTASEDFSNRGSSPERPARSKRGYHRESLSPVRHEAAVNGSSSNRTYNDGAGSAGGTMRGAYDNNSRVNKRGYGGGGGNRGDSAGRGFY